MPHRHLGRCPQVGNAASPADAPEQLGQCDFERLRDPFDVHERHVSLAALNPAHVGSVHPTHISERLLRPRVTFVKDLEATQPSWLRGLSLAN